MARWTQSTQEIRHLVDINEKLSKALEKGFLIKVVLTDGTEIEGILASQNSGNNSSGMSPITSYYGEIALRLLNRYLVSVDILDIQHVFNATSPEKMKKYEEAGVIEIVE